VPLLAVAAVAIGTGFGDVWFAGSRLDTRSQAERSV